MCGIIRFDMIDEAELDIVYTVNFTPTTVLIHFGKKWVRFVSTSAVNFNYIINSKATS